VLEGISFFWVLIGAITGLAVAEARDQPRVIFALVGAVLGIAALLLYFVTPANRCETCKAVMREDAAVCARCGAKPNLRQGLELPTPGGGADDPYRNPASKERKAG